jgi:carboxyl-terminal processing protease
MSRKRRSRRGPALLAAATLLACVSAPAQENLGFERAAPPPDAAFGWRVSARSIPSSSHVSAYTVELDASTVYEGQRSLRVAGGVDDGALRVVQRVSVDALSRGARRAPGQRIRLSGRVRTDAAAAGRASVWLRVAGGRGAIYTDSIGDALGDGARPAALAGAASRAPEPRRWAAVSIEVALPADAAEVAFGALLRGRGTAWFDALMVELVETADRPAPSAQAVRYIDAALAVMREHSVKRAELDWAALRADVLTQARGADVPAETYTALRYAVRNLNDHHSYFETPMWSGRLRELPVSNARTGRGAVAPTGVLLDGRIGYVVLPGFAGGVPLAQVAFANRVQQIIETLDISETCGWILDLRGNNGGNLWPMLAGVGPWLEGASHGLRGDKIELGASIYPDARRVSFWYRDGQAGFGDYVQLRVSVEPTQLRAPSAPLAVLTDGATASSAEVLAIALSSRPATRRFGAPTSGLTAGNRTFALADGASLVLTVAATSDAQGRVYSAPLEPDVHVDTDSPGAAPSIASLPATASDRVTAAAMAWLNAEPSCRNGESGAWQSVGAIDRLPAHR